MALIQKSVKKGNVNSNRNENALVDDVTSLVNTLSIPYELLSYSTDSPNVQITHSGSSQYNFVSMCFQVPALNLNKIYSYYIDKETNVSINIENPGTYVTINNENLGSSFYIGNINGGSVICIFNGKFIYAINAGSISTFNAPNLFVAHNFGSYVNSNNPIYLPQLKFITGYFGFNGNFTSISAPLLEASTNGYFQYSNNLTTINLPSLKYVGGDFNISALPSLTTVNLNSLEYVAGQLVVYNNGFFAMPVPQSLKGLGGSYLYFNNLSQAQVDASLIKLASLDGTNGTLIYKQANINILGAPPFCFGSCS